MDEINQDDSEVLETTETEESEQEETATDTLSAEEIAALKEKAAKAEEYEKKNKQLFARLKKEEAQEQTPGLSPKDLIALSKADIHPDDLEQLQEFAAFKKLTLADALTDPLMKAMLADRKAERKTAEATQTRGARGTTKPSDAEIAARAHATGEVGDDEESLQALWRGRMAHKLKK